MARDYVKEHPEYVRGVLLDSIVYIQQQFINSEQRSKVYCHYCGSSNVIQSTCHVVCNDCGQTSEGCGD